MLAIIVLLVSLLSFLFHGSKRSIDQNRPVYVQAAHPKSYNDSSFQEELRRRLKPEEVTIAINPFAANPKMRAWAVKACSGLTNDVDKAKAIYQAVVSHVVRKPFEKAETRTAAEAFELLDTPEPSLRCGDLTFLYVTLAREVGLEAFYTDVTKDVRNKPGFHCCSAVFVKDQALLVDLTYFRFGIPHREFQICDDIQAVSSFLAEAGKLETCRAAVKLNPYDRLAHQNLIRHLLTTNLLKGAEAELAVMKKLMPDAAETYYAQSLVAWMQKNPRGSEEAARMAIKLAPRVDEYHYALADILARQGIWSEARKEYQAVTNCTQSKGYFDDACERIAAMIKAEAANKGRP